MILNGLERRKPLMEWLYVLKSPCTSDTYLWLVIFATSSRHVNRFQSRSEFTDLKAIFWYKNGGMKQDFPFKKYERLGSWFYKNGSIFILISKKLNTSLSSGIRLLRFLRNIWNITLILLDNGASRFDSEEAWLLCVFMSGNSSKELSPLLPK